MNKEVRLYTPHANQRVIHDTINNGGAKYYTLNIGRQFGKTMLAMNQLLYWMLNHNGSKCAWVAPVYKQSKKVFDEMVRALPDIIEKNATELTIRIGNSTLQFFSAERYDNIRGFTFDYLVCDEFAFMDEQAWTEVLRATVLVKGKKVLLISTPKGKNHFFNLCQMAGHNEQYCSFTMTSYDNPLITPSEIDDAKLTLPDHVFRQEYLAEFIDGGGSLFSKMQFRQGAPTAKNYAGVDVGRADDYTVVTVLNENGEMVDVQRYRQQLWSTISDQVAAVINKYNAITEIEVNSIGDPFFEQIKPKVRQIFPFTTSAKTKPEIIEALMVASDDCRVTAMDVDWLKKELEVFTWEYSPKTRSVKYSAPSGFHDDGVMSFAIAFNCLRTKKFSGQYNIR
jgi:hypothetical protein